MSRSPRVIVWGINYAPEPIGIAPFSTGLAQHLQGAGLVVTVVTGFAYYPAWRRATADRGRIFRRDELDGVAVHRCWHHVPARGTTLGRMWHEVSFALMSLGRVLTLPRADLYVVVSPPLGLGLVAWVATRLKRSRFLFHVQDLQPDSAAGLGMVRAGLLLRTLYGVERFIYRRAAGVSGISAGMVTAFAAKGVPAEKIHLLPNWLAAAPVPAGTPAEAARFRRAHGIAPAALLAVYAGNLGRKQGLDVLLDAAAILGREPVVGPPIVILLAGAGVARAGLEARLAGHPPGPVRLLPLQSTADYAALLAAADVALITQLPGTGGHCFPSKLLSVLAAGRPVIALTDGTSDLAQAVRQGGFGCILPATDAGALVGCLRDLAAQPAQLARWAAATDWVARFAPEIILPRFAATLRTLLPGASQFGPAPAGRPLVS